MSGTLPCRHPDVIVMWMNQQGKYVLFKTDVTTGIMRFSIVSRTLPCRDPDVIVMWRNQQGKYNIKNLLEIIFLFV